MKKECGYAGTIPNAGAKYVKAPAQVPTKKGTTVKHEGKDLRSGK